jgi:hypothetical protein
MQDGSHVEVTGPDSKRQVLHFHCCMGAQSTQSDVIRGCGTTQLMDAALAGYNATIFAYGQTGSGKTYTMLGCEELSAHPGVAADEHEGITLRCMRHVFGAIANMQDTRSITVRASCLEVYKERIYDLLQPSGEQLALKWDPVKGFWVPDLKLIDCPTLDKMLRIARTCVKYRRTGAHSLNHESSRSHAILAVYLDVRDVDTGSPTQGELRHSKISFVDLAGSERVKETGAAGGTLSEANSINKSLFTLGKVIAALSEPV